MNIIIIYDKYFIVYSIYVIKINLKIINNIIYYY